MKLRSRLALLVVVVSLLVTTFSVEALATTRLTDIKEHWAQSAILSLVDEGVINGYEDNTFRPNRSVTRAEFAKIVALAFDIKPSQGATFSDVPAKHWATEYISALVDQGIIQGYPDGTFRPSNKITRAEALTMLARALDLLNSDQTTPEWAPSFSDVDPDHWAYIPVELTERLRVHPPQWTEKLQPEVNTTRAEIAHMVQKSLDFETTKGSIASIDTTTNTITIKPTVGSRQLFMLPNDAVVMRNGSVGDLSTFIEGDQVHILSEPAGDAVYVKAMGVLTQSEASNKISTLTKGLLGAEQVAAIMRGDWNALGSSIKPQLYDQLINFGASPEEAESLMTQNWANMSTLGQERIAAALSNILDVSPEMTTALLSGNWAQAGQLAQAELTTKILDALMF